MTNQIQTATSKSLQNQSPRQNSLLEHIQNNDELEIVKSIENSLQVARLENMDTYGIYFTLFGIFQVLAVLTSNAFVYKIL